MSNPNQQGDIFGVIGSNTTATNFNLSTLSSLVHFTFCCFYFVVASIQDNVGGILFINVIVLVQYCHNNEIQYNPFAVIMSVWLYCDNPRHVFYFLFYFFGRASVQGFVWFS